MGSKTMDLFSTTSQLNGNFKCEYLCRRGDFEGNAWERRSHCWKAAGTHGNGVPIVKVFRNAQERNAAVKDEGTFIAQSSCNACLHFTFGVFTYDGGGNGHVSRHGILC